MSTTVTGATPAARRSDLITRLVAGAAMIVVALVALWLGGPAFWLLASAAALLMLAEWAGLMNAAPARVILALAGLAVPLLVAFPPLEVRDDLVLMLLVGMAALVAIVTMSIRLGLGLLYAGLPVLGLLFIRDQPNGIALTLWTLATVWATDIGAYFAGRAIGGPKLAPKLSPNKTWAGLIGGMAAALIVGAVIALFTGLPLILAILGPLMAVLAQMGDLFESWLKRRAGVKDSGRLLPGHGGALDRLDGVVPVASLMALLAVVGWL